MTPSELKYQVEQTEPHFFSRRTMKFFGDRMANYGVRSTRVATQTGANVDVWELWRKRPVKHGLSSSAYFCKRTLERIFPHEVSA